MLQTLGHAEVPSTLATRARSGLTLGLLALTLAVGCKAPGMKLSSRPNSHERPEDVGGLSVTLHPLSPDLVNRQATRPPTPVDISALVADRAQPYRLGSQDVLLVTVWDHPEISLPMGPNRTDTSYGNLVDEEGNIFFPYVGKLKVAGMTVSQVRDSLTTQLAKSLRNPQVDVKVLVYRSQKVYVGGEVRNPAVYPVTDVPFTLAEAINRAGGLNPAADDSRMVLTRGSKSWTLNFQSILAMGTASGQILLQDGDSLQIPNASEEPVYLMGELMRPGNIPLVHGKLTLAKAISEVGGVQVTSADATSIYVIRSAGASNKVDVFHLDARNPASMILADKFALNPRDIVYVDAGTLVRFSRVMNLLLPTINAITAGTATGAQVYYFKKRL
ncbi:polysaccharide biosynthesis/export family protein [Mesoterricola silvestris]|uniref:Polysaccharide export protein Wza n=1 Tax=Mesoterricola silvestris TaxID=2927979 RepID=A0AA48GIQ4_9BACT|nr:polysaccharide biosynthesis/export family protein [Mesoterricola silvestris]BDU71784.1 polysaccharide export protein Wza [Mesoterricola silvestris]